MAKSITDKTETPAAAGHNGPDEAVFLKHVRVLIAAQAALDEAKSARSAVRKLAKADGIELKKLDAVVTMSQWEPGEVREHFMTLNQYAAWMGLPVGTQTDLFAGVAEAALPALNWEHKGYTAAITDKGSYGTPPSDCPPEAHQAWMIGVHKAQAKIAESMKMPATIEHGGSVLTEVDQEAKAAAEAEAAAEAARLTDDDGDIDPDKVAKAARKLKGSAFMERGDAGPSAGAEAA
jgi:hypothetical protein